MSAAPGRQLAEVRADIDKALAAMWQELLKASKASDSPTPQAAGPHLEKAGNLLLAAARRLA